MKGWDAQHTMMARHYLPQEFSKKYLIKQRFIGLELFAFVHTLIVLTMLELSAVVQLFGPRMRHNTRVLLVMDIGATS